MHVNRRMRKRKNNTRMIRDERNPTYSIRRLRKIRERRRKKRLPMKHVAVGRLHQKKKKKRVNKFVKSPALFLLFIAPSPPPLRIF